MSTRKPKMIGAHTPAPARPQRRRLQLAQTCAMFKQAYDSRFITSPGRSHLASQSTLQSPVR